MARLYDHYKKVIRPKLEKEFGYKNQLEIPRLEKSLSTWVWAAMRLKTVRPLMLRFVI